MNHSLRQILPAAILGAAENTIKVHLSHIFEKLGADNRHAAMLETLSAA
jgi:DNA-binding CsgD family transcriptional regulator